MTAHHGQDHSSWAPALFAFPASSQAGSECAEPQVVDRRQRDRDGHRREHPPGRPGALGAAQRTPELDAPHDHQQLAALPRLQPRDEQRAGGAERQHPGARSPAPALEPQQHERDAEGGDRREQVAPEVLPRPHLARDEVERVLAPPPAPAAEGHQRRRRHHGEQRQCERGVARAAGRDEPPHVAQRADEGDAHGDRLPDEQRQRDRDAQQTVQAGADQDQRVQERPVAGRQVPGVADQPVGARLADPREVLHLIGGQEAVGARERPALRHERQQRRDRQQGEQDQAAPARTGRGRCARPGAASWPASQVAGVAAAALISSPASRCGAGCATRARRRRALPRRHGSRRAAAGTGRASRAAAPTDAGRRPRADRRR